MPRSEDWPTVVFRQSYVYYIQSFSRLFALCTPGFELRQGRNVPLMEGIVVREYDREVLLDAWAAMESLRTHKAIEKKEAKILKARVLYIHT
jgi:hypothetical protein